MKWRADIRKLTPRNDDPPACVARLGLVSSKCDRSGVWVVWEDDVKGASPEEAEAAAKKALCGAALRLAGELRDLAGSLVEKNKSRWKQPSERWDQARELEGDHDETGEAARDWAHTEFGEDPPWNEADVDIEITRPDGTREVRRVTVYVDREVSYTAFVHEAEEFEEEDAGEGEGDEGEATP